MCQQRCHMAFACFCLFFFKFIYLFWERVSTSRKGAERRREGRKERENPKQASHHQHRAAFGDKLTNCKTMIWAEITSQTLNRLSHPGAPAFASLKLQHLSHFYHALYLFKEPNHYPVEFLTSHIWLLAISSCYLTFTVPHPHPNISYKIIIY